MLSSPLAASATLYWDADLNNTNTTFGGSGTWTSTSPNWSPTNTAVTTNSDQAFDGTVADFAGTAGTVTISGAQSLTGINFDTTNYSLQGGGLNFGSSAATIIASGSFSEYIGTNSALTGTATALSGSGGLTFTTTGTSSNKTAFTPIFKVNGTSTISGTITLNGSFTTGNVQLYALSNSALGTSSVVLENGQFYVGSGGATSTDISTGGVEFTTGSGIIYGNSLMGTSASNVVTNTLEGAITIVGSTNLGSALRGSVPFTNTVINGAISNGTGNSVAQTFGVATGGGTPTSQVTLNGVISDGVGGTLGLNFQRTGGSVDASGAIGSAGTAFIANTANTYTGITNINQGTVNVAALGNYGSASSLGAPLASTSGNPATALAADQAGLVLFGNQINNFSGELQYTGSTATSTNRLFTIGSNNNGGDSTYQNATLDASGTTTSATMSFTGTRAIGFGGTAGPTTLALVGTNTGLNTFAPAIADRSTAFSTSVTKQGAGTWVLSGTNTYGGATTVSAGTLMLGSSTALGASAAASTASTQIATPTNSAVVASGAVLDLNGQTITKTITLSGTGIGGAGALINSSATASTINGSTALTGLSLTSLGSGYSAPPTVTLAGGGGTGATATATLGLTAGSFTVTNGGTGYSANSTVVVSGGGGAGAEARLVLSGTTITGITIVNPGTGYTSAPTFTLSTTTGTAATVAGNATNFEVSGLTVSNVGTGYTSNPTATISAGTTTATATANLSGVILAANSSVGGTGNIFIAGTITDNGGGFGLTKVGTNTATLTGANTFTGATTISTGTLAAGAASTLATTSGITVNGGMLQLTATNALGAGVAAAPAGATGSLTGTVPVTLGGGTLQRGAAVSQGNGTNAIVGIGALTLTAGTTSILDFGTTGSGTLNFSSLTVGSGAMLNVLNDNNLSNGAGTEGSTDRLIFNQDVGTLLGSIEFNGVFDATEINLNNGEFEVIGAVPEPSTWVAGVLGFGLVGFHLRRRLGGLLTGRRVA